MRRFDQSAVSSTLARAAKIEYSLQQDFVQYSSELEAATQKLKQANAYLNAIRDQRYSEREVFIAAEHEQLQLKSDCRAQLEDLSYAVEAQRLRLDEISNCQQALAHSRRTLRFEPAETVDLPILQQKLDQVKLEVLQARTRQDSLRESLLARYAASFQARKQLRRAQLLFSLLVFAMCAGFLAR